jgi:hypothetical protein
VALVVGLSACGSADPSVPAAASVPTEKLGGGLAQLAGTSTTPPLPDVNALTAAGQELQQACT